MKNIGLIAGRSGDSLTDQLQKRGYKVVLIAGRETEPGMDKADYTLTTDLDNHDAVTELFKKHEVEYVIMGTGHIKAIRLAEKLQENGFVVSLDVKVSALAKDKVAFKKKLEEIGHVTPPYISFMNTFNIDEIISEIGLPCVVKSAIDLLPPQKASTKEELEAAIAEVIETKSEVLIEKYIKGNDLTVAVACDGKNTRALGVVYYSKAKEVKLKGFEEAFTERLSSSVEEKLIEISEDVAKKLNITGLSRLDFIIYDDIPYILELNSVIITGYTGATYPFFVDAGIDLPTEMIDNALRIYENKTSA